MNCHKAKTTSLILVLFAYLCCLKSTEADVVIVRDPIYRRSLTTEDYKVFKYTNETITHAESPVWDGDNNTLYWVDVINQNVHALELNTKQHRIKHIGYGEVNIVLPIRNSSRLLVCVRSEVFIMDWDKRGSSSLRLLAVVDAGQPDNVLNEGKADARGRFWGGTKGPQRGDAVVPDEGTLYRLEQNDFSPRVELRPVSISNGLVWAHNNSVLYYTDSVTKKIEAFDFDLDKGSISKRRTILDITDYGYTEAIPDGMTIDKEGRLWVALMFGGSVICIDPEARKIIKIYELPVSRTSSVSWSGRNLDELVITTSTRNTNAAERAAEPLSGCLFILHNLGTGGTPDHKFLFRGVDQY